MTREHDRNDEQVQHDEHDPHIVARVQRTLVAVAEATPISTVRDEELREVVALAELSAARPVGADLGDVTGVDPAGAAGLVGERRRPDRINGYPQRHRSAARARALAVAAVVVAVALVGAATWQARRQAPSGPGVVANGELTHRLEPGWLPDALDASWPPDEAGSDPEVEGTATRGLDVDAEAAVFRPADGSDGGVVVAAGDMSPATADAMAAALTRITRADQAASWSASGTVTAGGRGVSTVSWGAVDDTATLISTEVAGGARPADVTTPGWTATPFPVDWIPGIVRSETVRYRDGDDPAFGPWVELATTAGALPEPEVLDALLPGNQRIEVGGRTGWLSRPNGVDSADRPLGDRNIAILLWQVADGVIGSVTAYDLPDDDVRRIASEAHLATAADPAPIVEPRVVVDDETDDGTAFAVEAWVDSWRGAWSSPGPDTVCWRVRPTPGSTAPAPVCDGYRTFRPGGEVGGRLVLGAVLGAEVARIDIDGGADHGPPILLLGDGPGPDGWVAVIVTTETGARDLVVDLFAADGSSLGTADVDLG